MMNSMKLAAGLVLLTVLAQASNGREFSREAFDSALNNTNFVAAKTELEKLRPAAQRELKKIFEKKYHRCYLGVRREYLKIATEQNWKAAEEFILKKKEQFKIRKADYNNLLKYKDQADREKSLEELRMEELRKQREELETARKIQDMRSRKRSSSQGSSRRNSTTSTASRYSAAGTNVAAGAKPNAIKRSDENQDEPPKYKLLEKLRKGDFVVYQETKRICKVGKIQIRPGKKSGWCGLYDGTGKRLKYPVVKTTTEFLKPVDLTDEQRKAFTSGDLKYETHLSR